MRIVDPESGAAVPLGELGEIIVSGPQVMSGYLALPEADAKALRQIDGRTWMFTGDVGLMNQEGYVKVCDRSKDMLIVGGYKVFSVEVENKLQALPSGVVFGVEGKSVFEYKMVESPKLAPKNGAHWSIDELAERWDEIRVKNDR